MVSVQVYTSIYFLIVILAFFIVYWGCSYSINESEALAVALIAGLIWIALTYPKVIKTYFDEIPSNQTQMKFTIIFTGFVVTLTVIILAATMIGLLTFGKTRHSCIFKI